MAGPDCDLVRDETGKRGRKKGDGNGGVGGE